MARIPFTLEVWLKDKSQKVETRDGRIVHNIWPVKEPLIVNGKRAEVCVLIDGEEDALVFFEGGRYCPAAKETDNPYDLFIVTPEEELSEFENRLCEILDYAINHHIHSTPEKTIEDAKKLAPELLALARKRFIKEGYVIEKKAFHDAVENISDKHQAEMSVEYSIHCKVKDGTRRAVMNWDEFQKVAQKFIDIGKAEAMKDLPRWRKANGKERFNERLIVLAGDNDLWCTNYAEEGEYYIPFSDLEKLPKED